VFWQIGSDATLGGSSVFVGNLLALTSITVGANATIEGRALARNGAVTLIDDDFTEVGCDTGSTTTTSTDEATTSTTATAAGPPGPTTTTPSAATPGGGTGTGSPTPDTPTDLTEQGTGSPDSPDSPDSPSSPPGITGGPATPDSPPAITGGPATPDSPPAITEQGLGTPGGGTPALATTGSETTVPLLLAVLCFTLGAIAMRLGRQQDQVTDRHA
jgi:type VI secretion system secreted protein VgrG